jgi:hypothetical protein
MDLVINILKIKNAQRIGSSADPKIKYASDIDLQEFVNVDNFNNEVLQKFRKKFAKTEMFKNIFITDFKCGKFRGQPIRWDKHTINDGFQIIDGIRIDFVNCLQQKSIIKMDIIALIDGVFTEFSNNYYFTFSKGFSTAPITSNTLSNIFFMEFQKYIKLKKYYKALKRLYSYFKEKKDKKHKQIVRDFLNSSVGHFNSQINSLNIIYDVLENPFRRPMKSDVIHNLRFIQFNLPSEYKELINNILSKPTLQLMRLEIAKVIEEFTTVVNEKTMDFLHKEIKYQDII